MLVCGKKYFVVCERGEVWNCPLIFFLKKKRQSGSANQALNGKFRFFSPMEVT